MSGPALLVSLAAEDGAYMPSGFWEYRMKRLPHLGLLYLSAALRRSGRGAVVLDQSVHRFDADGLIARVGRTRPLFVGLYSTVTQRGVVCDAIRRLREAVPGVPVIVGGPDRVRADLYLGAGAGAAAVAVGEGEHLVVEIARALEEGAPLSGVPGLILDSPAGIAVTAPREPIEDLDSLAFPDRDAVPVDAYYDHHVFGMVRPYATVMASRGCPYRCTFCDSPAVWGNRVRLRSPGNVLAELRDLSERYGVRYVGFKDDQFAVNPAWEEELLGSLAAASLPLRWSCLVHPFNFRARREEKLRRFRDAGCDLLSFGLQAVDPAILKSIHRNAAEPAELAENVKVARRLGMTVAVHFIFGLPGDHAGNMEGAVAWARRVRPHYTVFFPLSVLEESELGRTVGTDRSVSGIAPAELDRAVQRAYRRVYASPRLLLQDLVHVLRKNPRWLGVLLRHAGYVFRSTLWNRVEFRVNRPGAHPSSAAAEAMGGRTPAFLAPYG